MVFGLTGDKGGAIVLYRRLGRTGLKVSAVGFGGIPIQRVSNDEAAQLLAVAQQAGINFIDTARGYAASEEKIGFAMSQVGGEWIVASKSMQRDAAGFRSELEQSLRLLRRAYIDVYQLHNVSSAEAMEQVFAVDGAYRAALKARDEGLIRYVGFTSHKPQFVEEALNRGGFDTIQVPYNPVESQFTEVIRRAAEQDVGVIVMKPLAGGALGQVADLSLRYILENEDVSTVIPGMQSLDEVRQNSVVVEDFRPLNQEERDRLTRVAEELGQEFCRRCEYCLPCPQGIKIPTVFIFEGYYSRYNLQDWALERYNALPAKASACVECGLCEERCPYDLPIRKMLKRVAGEMEK